MNVSHRSVVVWGRAFLALSLGASVVGCSLWGGGSDKPKPADLGPNVPVLGVRQVWMAKLAPVHNLPLAVQVQG